MATLTATGINFGTNDDLNSKRGIFPLHVNDSNACVWIFYQNTTPTGWSKLTTQNNKALRVVSGAGGGSGGTNDFTSTMSNFIVGGPLTTSNATGDHKLLATQIPSHNHGNGGSIGLGANPQIFNPAGAFTGYSGGDVSRGFNLYGASWRRTFPDWSAAVVVPTPPTDGVAAGHSHPVSGSGTVPNQTVTFNVQYIDIIFCTFNG